MRHISSKKCGMTLIEVSVALLFIGVIAIMTLPGVIRQSNQNVAVLKLKDVGADILSARQKFFEFNINSNISNVPDVDYALNEYIPEMMRFSKVVGSAGGYRYANGAVCTIPEGRRPTLFNGDYFVEFQCDPDGATPNYNPAYLTLNITKGRIAPTTSYLPGTDAPGGWCRNLENSATASLTNVQPAYVLAWSNPKRNVDESLAPLAAVTPTGNCPPPPPPPPPGCPGPTCQANPAETGR